MKLKQFKRLVYSLCPLSGSPDAGRFRPQRITLTVLCVLCSVILITGCASTDDIGRMQWDINDLRSEVKKLKKTSQSTARMDSINTKLDEMEETQKSTGQTVSDLLIQVQTLTSEFQVLTGRFEESRYFSEKSSAELLESKDMLVAKMKELEQSVADLEKKLAKAMVSPPVKKTVIPKKEVTQKTGAAKEVKKEAGDNKDTVSAVKDTYMSAYQAFKDGNTSDAREKFNSLLKDFPENDYSDNARFWIGETYYKEGKFEDAILAYQELFDKNPKSDKVPGAMLKQGLAFYSLKDQKTGKIILEKLVEKYPDSDQAKLAARKIKKPSVLPKKKK